MLTTNPDGSPRRELYVGDLTVRVTDAGTGAYHDADASGQAVIEYEPDGAQNWYVHGPVLIGFGADGRALPRGLYVVDGTYRLVISPTGQRTLTKLTGTVDELCRRVA